MDACKTETNSLSNLTKMWFEKLIWALVFLPGVCILLFVKLFFKSRGTVAKSADDSQFTSSDETVTDELDLQENRTKMYRKDCKPMIKSEHIQEIRQHIKQNGGEVDEGGIKYCLLECEKLLKCQTKKVMQHARINVYCEWVVSLEAESPPEYLFDIVYDGNGGVLTDAYRNDSVKGEIPRIREISIECCPFIGFGHILAIEDRIQQNGHGIEKEKFDHCILQCKELVQSQNIQILRNARITVYLRRATVSFLAGPSLLHCFDIVYDANNGIRTKAYKNCNIGATDALPIFNKVNCSVITFAEVHHVLKEQQQYYGEKYDYYTLFLGECAKLIKEQDIKDLANATIKLYCEHSKTTLSAGTGFNCYDLLYLGDGKVYTKIYSKDDTDSTLEEVTYNPINVQSIKKEIRKLGRSSDDEFRKCLQHCTTVIEKENNKYGAAIWDHAEILITSSSRGLKIVSGEGTKKYRVYLDEHGHPKYESTTSTWRQMFWDGYECSKRAFDIVERSFGHDNTLTW